MRAEILIKDQYKKWDDFAVNHPYTSIHQTSLWAHFQSNVAARDKFWIIGLYGDKNFTNNPQSPQNKTEPPAQHKTKHPSPFIAGTVLIRHKIPRGYTWLYSPRGPLLSYDNPEQAEKEMAILLEKIKEIAKGEKTIFYRIDPLIELKNSSKDSSKNLSEDISKQTQSKKLEKDLHFPSFHFSHLGYQPEDTLILDLTKTEEEILSQMKEKGRYNIRLAAKKGVEIEEVEVHSSNSVNSSLSPHSQAQIQAYFDILQETLERDKFHGHGISFYKNMVEKLAPKIDQDFGQKEKFNHPKSLEKTKTYQLNTIDSDKKTEYSKLLDKGFSKMFLAKYNGKYLAGIIGTFYSSTGIYYFGASSNQDRNVMAPYLLQWHAIKFAKSIGCTKYDLLGIAPETPTDELGPKNHHWRGVTGFKRKFGGNYIKYLPPQEFAFKKFFYFLFVLGKKLRRLLK